MAFVSYATVKDLMAYVPEALDSLMRGDEQFATDLLRRAARVMNEKLLGIDRVETVPVPVEDDGAYAEVLVRTNVYEAVWLGVSGEYAGEAFDSQWRWVRIQISEAWDDVESGKFSFGSEPLQSKAGAKVVHLHRAST
jgi:hypothetical protein